MKIDIIVPTYNRLHDIQTFINKIESQDYDNYKVYIIDDCSDYDIQSIVPNNDKFIFVRLDENKGQAYARNYAVSISSGDILVFMDDDAYFLSNSALSNLVMYFNQNDISGFVVPAAHHKLFATKLQEVWQNKEKLEEYGQRAYKTISTKFDECPEKKITNLILKSLSN